MTRALKDENALVQIAAASALWKIDQRADLAVPVLIQELMVQCQGQACSWTDGATREAEFSTMNQFVAYPPAVDRWDDLISVFGGSDGRGDCGSRRCMW